MLVARTHDIDWAAYLKVSQESRAIFVATGCLVSNQLGVQIQFNLEAGGIILLCGKAPIHTKRPPTIMRHGASKYRDRHLNNKQDRL